MDRSLDRGCSFAGCFFLVGCSLAGCSLAGCSLAGSSKAGCQILDYLCSIESICQHYVLLSLITDPELHPGEKPLDQSHR